MSVDTVEVPQTTPPAPTGDTSKGSEGPKKPGRLDSFQLALVAHPVLRNSALVICIGLFALAILVIWFAWFKLLPDLWNWAFTEFSQKSIIGGFGVLFLAVLPVYFPIGAFIATAYVVEVYADEAAKKI